MCVLGVARISVADYLTRLFATDVRPIVYVRTPQTSLKMVSVLASGVETAFTNRAWKSGPPRAGSGPPAVADRQMGN